MADERKKNANWRLSTNENGTTPHGDAELAVLMDIRDELQDLNRLLACPNFRAIPSLLRLIRTNTAKPRKPRRKPVKVRP